MLSLLCYLTLIGSLSLVVKVVECGEYAYTGDLGVGHWKDMFPECDGKRQSPIAIKTGLTRYDSALDYAMTIESLPLTNKSFNLINNGHSLAVDVLSLNEIFTGLSLPGSWLIVQFHFHWGDRDHMGSEHTINDNHYPAECHVVMRNTKYRTMNESLINSDGLAVLAVLFKVGEPNKALQPLIDAVDEILEPGAKVRIPAFRLINLLPKDRKLYYRYSGSLTTPNCYEVVTWTVFGSLAELSMEQLNIFRTLLRDINLDHPEAIVNNFRPPQPLNGRIVRRSSGCFLTSTTSLLAISLAFAIGRLSPTF